MKGYAVYREESVATQTPGRLIVLLYDGAIKALHHVIEEMQTGDHEEKARHFNKAIDIIQELNMTLDLDRGGQIADNLRRLYLFMIGHLNQANVKREPRMVHEIIALLEKLNEGWKAVTV